MLKLHPASALEYFFFKVNAPPVALIVDWIARRRLDENILRVSIHSPQGREVIFEKLAAFLPADNFLSTERTLGHAGDVAWDLAIEMGSEQIKPDVFPVGLLKLSDTLYLSAPQASFSGWIRHGGETFPVQDSLGSVTQYWGRRLMPEWWWLSAHQFEPAGVAVEASVFQTGIWGTDMRMPFAFLYLFRNGKGKMITAPPYTTKVDGTADKFSIEFSRQGRKPLTLVGTGRDYGDFGEGIRNTLTGDLEIYEGGQLIGRAAGTAALERKAPEGRGV